MEQEVVSHNRRTRLSAAVGPLLHSRTYRLLFSAQLVSRMGDTFTLVALPFAVLRLTGSVADVGYVLAAKTVPVVLFVLPGGMIADRVRSRGSLIVGCHSVRFLTQGILASLLLVGTARIWQIYILMAIYGLATSAASPAMTGLLPQTVAATDLQRANALSSFTTSSTTIAGPALAGILVALAGPGWAIGIDASSFAVGAILIAAMRLEGVISPRESEGWLTQLGAGWREVRGRTWLWVSICGISIVQLVLTGPLYVLGPAIIYKFLGGASVWGALLAVSGVGSLVGDALALRFHPSRLLTVAFLSLLACAPVLLFLGLVANIIVVAAAMLLFGAGLTFGDTLWYTALQQNVPREKLSRVSAYDWLGTTVCLSAGQVIAGPVANVIGVRQTLICSAAVILCIGILVTRSASVRGLRAHVPQEEK